MYFLVSEHQAKESKREKLNKQKLNILTLLFCLCYSSAIPASQLCWTFLGIVRDGDKTILLFLSLKDLLIFFTTKDKHVQSNETNVK